VSTPSHNYITKVINVIQECPSETGMEFTFFIDSLDTELPIMDDPKLLSKLKELLK